MRRRIGLKALAATGLWALAGQARATTPAGESVPTGPQDLDSLVLLGQGTMRFFGFAVYDARLWAKPALRPAEYAQATLALELRYRRTFTGAAIAQRSIQEMRRVGAFDDTQAQRWQASLQAALPDVQEGDRLLGIHRPGRGAEFWRDARVTGRVADAEFSRLFFGIWLSPQTSAPDLRQALLARVLVGS